MLRSELADVLPRERPAGWPPGLSWDIKWVALSEHCHQYASMAHLARRYGMTHDQMRHLLSESRNMAHELGLIP
jgi:hypothetical protein